MKHRIAATALLALAVMVGCRRESAPADTVPTPSDSATPPVPTEPAPLVLQDVTANTPQSIVGISYPRNAQAYPQPLARALHDYAEASRAELTEAVDALGGQAPRAPYDMSLSFTELVSTPQVLAIAADGSVYTGGAHGNPLMARFVWLPQQQRMLTAAELIPDAASWRTLSDHVREQLHTALSQRVDADRLEPAVRAEVVSSAGKLIDSGTKPGPEDFSQFEPVMAPDGTITALRFVFPPYQVGPYSDGVQTVEVPAALLAPLVAEQYRGLFATR